MTIVWIIIFLSCHRGAYLRYWNLRAPYEGILTGTNLLCEAEVPLVIFANTKFPPGYINIPRISSYKLTSR